MAKYLVAYRYLIDTDKDPAAFDKCKPETFQYLLEEQVQKLTAKEWQEYKKLEGEYEQESLKAEKWYQEYLKREPGDY